MTGGLHPRLGILAANPTFARLWLARSISLLGDGIANAVLVLYVYDLAGAGTAVGALLLAQAAPRLLGPLADTIADRVDQRRLMLACEGVQGLIFSIIALVRPTLPALLLLVAASALAATVFAPAGRGALPAIVPADDLTRANALLSLSFNASLAIGPAIGGFVVAGASWSIVFGLNALTFLLAALLLRRLPPLVAGPPPAAGSADSAVQSLLDTMREGWRYLWRHPVVRLVALGLMIMVAFAALDNVALVFLARSVLDTNAAGYGLLASAWGFGMVVGSLAVLRLGSAVSPLTILGCGVAMQGAGLLLTGVAPQVAIALLTLGLAGIGNGLENIAVDTVIQTEVPRPLLGRIFGITYSGAFVASNLAYAAGGLLIDHVSPRVVFIIAGSGVLGTLLLFAVLLRRAGAWVEAGVVSKRSTRFH